MVHLPARFPAFSFDDAGSVTCRVGTLIVTLFGSTVDLAKAFRDGRRHRFLIAAAEMFSKELL
jgi:hypothetical protein